jgi:hypothetical protein
MIGDRLDAHRDHDRTSRHPQPNGAVAGEREFEHSH